MPTSLKTIRSGRSSNSSSENNVNKYERDRAFTHKYQAIAEVKQRLKDYFEAAAELASDRRTECFSLVELILNEHSIDPLERLHKALDIVNEAWPRAKMKLTQDGWTPSGEHNGWRITTQVVDPYSKPLRFRQFCFDTEPQWRISNGRPEDLPLHQYHVEQMKKDFYFWFGAYICTDHDNEATIAYHKDQQQK